MVMVLQFQRKMYSTGKQKKVRNEQNTPGIIKYPFWRMTYQNPRAVYVCVNLGEAFAPLEIKDRSICVDGDIGEVLECL